MTHRPGDEEESHATKGVVSPFVRTLYKGTNQSGDDHDFIDQNGVHDGWSGQSAGEQKIEEKKWRGDDPCRRINVL